MTILSSGFVNLSGQAPAVFSYQLHLHDITYVYENERALHTVLYMPLFDIPIG